MNSEKKNDKNKFCQDIKHLFETVSNTKPAIKFINKSSFLTMLNVDKASRIIGYQTPGCFAKSQ